MEMTKKTKVFVSVTLVCALSLTMFTGCTFGFRTPDYIAFGCLIKLVAREPKYYNEYHSDIARLLVEHEADISVADSNGMTAYDYAVKFGRTELYELLKP